MTAAPTLLHILHRRAQETPDQEAFRFYGAAPLTYGDLWHGIMETAALLIEKVIRPGEPVLVLIPNSAEFFFAFYGVQAAGGTAVPVFPGSGVERIIRLAGLCDAAHILTAATVSEERLKALQRAATSVGKRIHTIGAPKSAKPLPVRSPAFPDADAWAFIQYTSGSTGDPKGVCLSHRNLMENLGQMIEGFGITSADRFCSWLPVYHDMGLILMTMVPFYLGLPLFLLPTGLNYLRPWLRSMTEQRTTFTAAPDFAYRYCLRLLGPAQRAGIDLSHLRIALNAAEPVRSGTIADFQKAFAMGNVMLPAYGLAEATVGVSAAAPGQPVKMDAQGNVSVGKPFPGIDIRIAAARRDVRTGAVGEILVHSPANTAGYLNNPAATEALLTADGFIRTGDMGYLDNAGDLFILGRLKNVIIQGGFTLAAREIEELTEQLPFVHQSAAVGIDRQKAEGERVFIFAEVNLKPTELANEDLTAHMAAEIVQAFESNFAFRPGRVFLVKRGTIPKTYNGKIQYAQLRAAYLEGILEKEGRIVFPV